MSRYFYFKFSRGNVALSKLIKKHGHLTKEKKYPMAIYWGEWKVKDKNSENFSKNVKNSINLFCNLKANDFLFLFHNNYVYIFEATSDTLKDFESSPDKEVMIFEEYTTPKYRNFKYINSFKRSELPDFFYRLNSNQKYNRKTIAQLVGADLETAKSITMSKTIPIDQNNFLEYMSPLQFESMLSLMFYEKGKIPGTYRGGTMANIDIVIYSLDLKEETYYQIKYKEYSIKEGERLIASLSQKENKSVALLHLGKCDESKNIFGKNWITNEIMKTAQKSQQFRSWIMSIYSLPSIFSCRIQF